MGFKYSFCYILPLLALAAFVPLIPFVAAIESPSANTASADFPIQNAAKNEYHSGFSNSINEVYIYEVIRGERRKTLLRRKDFENRRIIDCDGYVCGVELVSKNGRMIATLEEGSTDVITEDDVGTKKAFSKTRIDRTLPDQKLYRYAYFPKVTGDAVSIKDYFSISIKSERDRYELYVRQKGYQVLFPTGKTWASDGDEPIFRYLGTDMAQFEAGLHDFKNRLVALSEGIGFVENAVARKLVRCVNIVEYKGPDNALTSWGKSQIWIYADTFRNRKISELKNMAEHETLHIFVDQQGYARQLALRDFFSDLHGFEPLSLERFSLVTRGTFPSGVVLPTGKTSPLFAFINERNFIPEMSGGHAGDNLDEFCASFLHTLLYIDQLSNNINKSELVMADGSLETVSLQERKTILRDYRRAIDMFMASAPKDNLQETNRFYSNAFSLFDKSMNAAACVNVSD